MLGTVWHSSLQVTKSLRTVLGPIIVALLVVGFSPLALPWASHSGSSEKGITSAHPAGTVNTATTPDVLDSRPIRVRSQDDFVYSGAGAHQYFTSVAASPDPSFATISTSTNFASFLALGDWNRDGKDDLFDATANYVSVTLRASDPASADLAAKGATYQLAFYTTRYYVLKGLAAGDWDGDGYVDSFVASQYSNTGTSYKVDMRRTSTGGATDGYVYQLVYTTSDAILSVAAGDFNGDGRADLALIVQSGTLYYVRVVLSAGTSSCRGCVGTYGIFYAKVTGTPTGVAMGDWDRDGYSDVIFAEQRSSTDYRYDVLFGRKSASSGPVTDLTSAVVQIMSTTIQPITITSGDWNNDGRDDLIVLHYGNSASWRDVKITYSGSTGPGNAATGGLITITLYEPVYGFAAGDWSGDSVFARYAGVRGNRDIPVPVAMLTPPPFDSSRSDIPSGYAFYGTGTTVGGTYTGTLSAFAGAGVTFGDKFRACIFVCLAEFELKFEVMLSGHVTLQWGRTFETRQDIQTQVQGTDFYNSATGTYEPVVIVAHWQYDDYKLEFYKVVAGTVVKYFFPTSVGQGLGDFVINLPIATNTWIERKFLSNYNAGRPPDMPALSFSRVGGDLNSYRTDSVYTTAPLVWSGPLSFSEFNGRQASSVTLSQGNTLGWETGWQLQVNGEISGTVATVTAGFIFTAGLAGSDLWTLNHGSSFTIGGQPAKLVGFWTDSWPGEEYETYGYWSRAYVKKISLPTRVSVIGLTLLVLDWKVEFMNEGYPAKITSTSKSSSTVSLYWMHSGGVDPSGASRRTGYYVEWSTSSSFSTVFTSSLLGSSTSSFTVGSLAASTTYYFRVKAVFNSPTAFTNLSGVVSVTTSASGGGGGGGGGNCPPICPI